MDGRVGYTTASLPSRVGGWTATCAFFCILEFQGRGVGWGGSIYVERGYNVFLSKEGVKERTVVLRWGCILYVSDLVAEMAWLRWG